MAQNTVLSWLAGSRILELKTVQINDRLTIPRPCIDMTNVGYNVESCQELRLRDSLRDYVSAPIIYYFLCVALLLCLPPYPDKPCTSPITTHPHPSSPLKPSTTSPS